VFGEEELGVFSKTGVREVVGGLVNHCERSMDSFSAVERELKRVGQR
jgi:hypothetical protein